MKRFRLAVFIATCGSLIAIGAPMRAQGQPDFSGTWWMDASRSESVAQQRPADPVTLVITQNANDLRIETKRGDGSSAVTYKLDGSEVTIPGGTARTSWEGSTLVTHATRFVQGQAVTTKETRRLAPDGNEMLVERHVYVQHGYNAGPNSATGKDIYVRSR